MATVDFSRPRGRVKCWGIPIISTAPRLRVGFLLGVAENPLPSPLARDSRFRLPEYPRGAFRRISGFRRGSREGFVGVPWGGCAIRISIVGALGGCAIRISIVGALGRCAIRISIVGALERVRDRDDDRDDEQGARSASSS
jgi:hypothetical protein